MKLRTLTALVVLVLVAIVATSLRTAANGDLPLAKAESVGMSAERLERVHAFIQNYIE